MILMCVLWRRLRLNQEGSKTFSLWVAHGTSPRYSDIIYGCFFTINSIPYMTYSNKNTLSTDCLAQLLLCFHTFTLSEYMKDHIIELWRKIWSYDWSWHLCTNLEQLLHYLKPEKKIRLELTGFESMTSAIPVQCSTDWAITPTWSWSHCDFVIYPRRVKKNYK